MAEVPFTERLSNLTRKISNFSMFKNDSKEEEPEKNNKTPSPQRQSSKGSPLDVVDEFEGLLPWGFVDGVDPSQSPEEHVQYWLKDQPVNTSELSSLRREDRRMIAKERPNSRYDLMPLIMRSETYFVQFDMDTAKPRFIIRHRSATCTYDCLSQEDKIHLLQVAQEFAQKFEFQDATLTVPLGVESQIGIVYATFYAYVVVRETEKFISFFRWATKEHKILAWPSIKRWRTPFWVEDINSYQSINIYIESVRSNASTYTPTEFFLMSRRKISSNPTTEPSDFFAIELVDDFTVHSWQAKRIVGVRSGKLSAQTTSFLDRWQYQHYMAQLVQEWKHQEPDDISCWMSLSLSNPFQIINGIRTPALVLFPFGVPRFLWPKKEPEKPKTRRNVRRLSKAIIGER